MRALLLAVILFAIAAPARADRFSLSYDGAGLGLIPLGEVTVDADVSDDSYQISATLRSGGLLNLFERTNLTASSSGDIRNGAVVWRRYTLDHHYSRKHRVVVMQTGEDGAVTAEITPNYRIWGTPPASDEAVAVIRRSTVTIGGRGLCGQGC